MLVQYYTCVCMCVSKSQTWTFCDFLGNMLFEGNPKHSGAAGQYGAANKTRLTALCTHALDTMTTLKIKGSFSSSLMIIGGLSPIYSKYHLSHLLDLK